METIIPLDKTRHGLQFSPEISSSCCREKYHSESEVYLDQNQKHFIDLRGEVGTLQELLLQEYNKTQTEHIIKKSQL